MIKKMETDLYIIDLIDKGVTVEFWDLSSIFFTNKFQYETINKSFVIRIMNYNELYMLLLRHSNKVTIYFSLMSLSWETIKLFRWLTITNSRTAFFSRGTLPNIKSSSEELERLINKITKIKNGIVYKGSTTKIFL